MSTTDVPAAPKKRPGWLTAFAIGAILLGAAKLCWAIYILGAAKMLEIQRHFVDKLPSSPVHDLQKDFFSRVTAVCSDFVGQHFVAISSSAIFGALVVVGGIGAFRPRRWSRRALLVGLLGMLACDLGLATAEVRYDTTLNAVNEDYLTAVFAKTHGANVGMANQLAAISQTARKAGLVVRFGWLGLQAVLCAAGFAVLAREPMKHLFEGGPTAR